jgi:predicted HicB family RNase H-like nuclease
MEHRGYVGLVEFDEDAEVFHGEVVNLRDVVTFEGRSVRELRKAFEESVNDYLEFCRQRGEEPEKPFSGRILVRIEPELHRDIYLSSRAEDKSLNSWIGEALDTAVSSRDRKRTKKEAG